MPESKSFTRGDIKSSLQSVRHNKLRSVATVFGIVIALMAIIVIIGIGDGVKNQVGQQIQKLGKDIIMVRPKTRNSPVSGSLGSLAGSDSVTSLSYADYQDVKNTGGVASAVPLSTVNGTLVTDKGNTSFSGAVVATTDDFLSILSQELQVGSFFSPNTSSARAVLGANVAVKLFNENIPLGRSFELNGQEFVVTGILKQFNSNPLLGDADFNNAIFIKYSTARQMDNIKPEIYEILAKTYPKADVGSVVERVGQHLARDHRGNDDFAVLAQGKTVQATSAIYGLLTEFVVGAAAVALILGGIGVMNIMFVSVTERMHEIGVRKAVGATNNQILIQFLMESSILSLMGGVIGFVLGLVAIKFLDLFSSLHPVMPWSAAAWSVLAAVLIGALFGAFPALKAARKDPIDALRNE